MKDNKEQQLQTLQSIANQHIKQNSVLQLAAEQSENSRAFLIRCEQLQKVFSQPPKVVKTNKFANNSQYVPISHIQTLLDTYFFGLWETVDYKQQVVGNELVGQVTLQVWHPVAEKWLKRTGVAATQIRMHKGAKMSDGINAKIQNALEMDAPHLYADCLKSAAKTFGAAFGRDLNRDFADNYKTLVSQNVSKNTFTIAEVKEKLKECTTAEQVTVYFSSNPEFNKNKEVQELCGTRCWELQNRGA